MIFYDRGYRAQDNAEYLCRWVMENHPEVKTGYILNHTSYDWKRLDDEGFYLIDGLNREKTHKELLKCNYACSSIFNEEINLDFSGCTCSRIFLNHGIFLAPIKYIKDECNNIDLFIASNKIEYNTLLNPFHKLDRQQVALCGQPRQDNLVLQQNNSHEENTILIQFWQRPGDWCKENNKKFLESTFYKKTSELLTNKKLIDICKKNNLKIVFKMHPIQYDWLKYYKKYESNIIEISDISKLFEPEFIRSKFMITDISSNVYEMAKINKPCIYFEPDAKELFSWRSKRNGGHEFDLIHNSIGPVIYGSIDKLVAEIEKLINNNYQLDQLYIDRRSKQLAFLNDTNNCKRCFDAILKVNTSKTAVKTANEKRKAERKKADNNGYYLYF